MDSALDEIELKRLDSIRKIGILDTPSEERFDRITLLATRIFSVPVSGISLIDKKRVWFKSVHGIDIREINRENSLDNLVVESGQPMVEGDLTDNSRFDQFQLVREDPKLSFYAGIPISDRDGIKIGALFIADRAKRSLSDLEINTLKDLASWAETEIRANIVSFQNIAEQEKIKRELAVKNRELESEKAKSVALLENIGDGVIGINDRGEVNFVNKQVEIITGYSEGDLLNKPLWFSIKLIDKEGNELPVNKRPIRNALYHRRRVASSDYSYLKKDGEKVPVAITSTPIIILNQIIGGVNVFRDITKEKEVDRMKTEFISLASHQLRTPLSAMKWFSEILLDGDAGELTDEQKELLINVYKSNERMIELVNTLLNISRIESGRIIIDPIPTDIKKLVDEVVVEIKPKLELKRQHLGISVHGQLPEINVDPKLVRHVYMNLLTNAIKYSREGGEILILISKTDKEIISQISDNGYGIPKSQQSKVFNKFFRGENIVKIETDGTGLGLYLTKAIVESSGGRIWFESFEDQGTTFWFALPLVGSVQKEGEVSIDA